MNPILRNNVYYIRRRCPKRYASIETRIDIWISLHTDSLDVAKSKMQNVWDHTIMCWEDRLAGRHDNAETQYEAAKNLAGLRGYRFIPAAAVAKLPLTEIVDRVRATQKNGKTDKVEAAALLGLAKRPEITVVRALEMFWGMAEDRTFGKSEDQMRRWKNPRIKSIKNFTDLIGNKLVSEVSADDMLDFRDWWIDRIKHEGLTANSANKDFTHLADVLKTVNRMKRLNIDLPVGNISIAQGEYIPRPPFSTDWIKDVLLGKGMLNGLNPQARDITYALVNTGARPSEVVSLLPQHIHLSHNVPHIEIASEGKTVKTKESRRVIPLVGVSLEAMRRNPEGFPQYRFKSTYSATSNKFLRENNLMESEKHTIYCLRHTFQDQIERLNVTDRMDRDLMGHALGRQRYGAGPTLEEKQAVLHRFAF